VQEDRRQMLRLMVAALAAAVIAAGCGAPGPSPIPAAIPTVAGPTPTHAAALPTVSGPTPTPEPTFPEPTDAPQPSPTFPVFDAAYPESGWSVAAFVDGTGAVHRVWSTGRATAGALIDLAFACDVATRITIRPVDTSGTGIPFGGTEAACQPGRINRSTAPSIGSDMRLGLDVTVDDSAVRFWVKLAVPADHFVPPN
jgi:hypothetical protein